MKSLCSQSSPQAAPLTNHEAQHRLNKSSVHEGRWWTKRFWIIHCKITMTLSWEKFIKTAWNIAHTHINAVMCVCNSSNKANAIPFYFLWLTTSLISSWRDIFFSAFLCILYPLRFKYIYIFFNEYRLYNMEPAQWNLRQWREEARVIISTLPTLGSSTSCAQKFRSADYPKILKDQVFHPWWHSHIPRRYVRMD